MFPRVTTSASGSFDILAPSYPSGINQALPRPTTVAQPRVAQSQARPKPLQTSKLNKQSRGSKKRTGDDHFRNLARNQREKARSEANKPKPKPKPKPRIPGAPRENKYPPKTGPNSIPKDPNNP